MSGTGSPPETLGEVESLSATIKRLERDLAESRAANRALVSGQVDAVVDDTGAFLLDQAQTALQESEELFRTIVTNADEGIWILDAEMVTAFANQRFAAMLGFTVEELIGRPGRAYFDDEGRKAAQKSFDRRKLGHSHAREITLVRKDGTLPLGARRLEPSRRPQGRVRRLALHGHGHLRAP